MPPPFENFSLDILNSEQKPSVKKPVDRAGQAAMILKFTGRVEKILIGFISVLLYVCIFNVQYNAYYCFSCFACISEV